MIQWRYEGKLWEFLVNNEVDFDEDDLGFYEYIFLDKYLENFLK